VTRLDILASERHYLSHLAPIAHAFGTDAHVFCSTTDTLLHARELGLDAKIGAPRGPTGPPVLVASYRDSNQLDPARPRAYLEHGVGQSYTQLRTERHRGVPGGRGWERCELFLVAGPHAAQEWRTFYPETPIVQLGGSPRLDQWAGYQPHNDLPVVAFSWHWDMRVVPETRASWRYWAQAVAQVTRSSDRFWLGHAHPRYWSTMEQQYRRLGIAATRSFTPVMQTADLYVIDNSSTAFEMASFDRPVLSLNCPTYRRDVEHGLRFWSHVPGLEVDDPADLAEAIDAALCDKGDAQVRRRRAVDAAYGRMQNGCATARAVEAITDWLDHRTERKAS
jgi:hypothetical protein